jgi:hypothetical protein
MAWHGMAWNGMAAIVAVSTSKGDSTRSNGLLARRLSASLNLFRAFPPSFIEEAQVWQAQVCI